MIINHLDKDYHPSCKNGANIYSQLICKFFVPNVKTERNWVTINVGKCVDNSIVFIHSNLNANKKHAYLKDYKNLILVCSQVSTMKDVQDYGIPVYLPLSIDTHYVKSFMNLNKDRNTCYAGRKGKTGYEQLKNQHVDLLCDMSHDELLKTMAKYLYVYAVGLTAIEALCLGCNLLPYDQRFPDPSVWKVKDCRNMIPVLQNLIDMCDKVVR